MAFKELDNYSRQGYLQKVYNCLCRNVFGGTVSALVDVYELGHEFPPMQIDTDIRPDDPVLCVNLDTLLPMLPDKDTVKQSAVIVRLMLHEMLHLYCLKMHGERDEQHGELFTQASAKYGIKGAPGCEEPPEPYGIIIASWGMPRHRF